MSRTYTALARPVGRVWDVEVPEVRRSTQAHRIRDIAVMAADLIAAMTDADVEPDQVTIDFVLPHNVQMHLDEFEKARAVEATAHARAVAEQRAAARELVTLGYSRRDAGALLGISHQRVQQLIAS